MASGDLTLGWTRRTRIGGEWASGSDVELGEDSEEYEIDIRNGATVLRTLTSTTNSVLYSAANQTTDFAGVRALVSFAVRQLGTYGDGYESLFSIPYLLPGLVLAYEPDAMLPTVADNVAITKVFDRGPRQAHLSEATNAPSFQTNEVNSLPILRFDGTDDRLATAVAPITGGMARSVYMVVKRTSAASDLVPAVNLNHGVTFAAGAAFIITPDPTLRVESGNRLWTPVQDITNYHVLSVHLPAGGSTSDAVAWRDGAVLAVNTTVARAVDTGTNGVALGRRNDTNVTLAGDLGDVFIYNTNHSDAHKLLMHNHLKARFNL